jgi:dihydroflavonol-4-reductase
VPYKEPSKEEAPRVIKTAVDGALSVLRAAAKHGVKRVVMTSSVAAVRDRFPKDRLPVGQVYTEEHWSDIEF